MTGERYCSRCGKRLVRKVWQVGFSRETGQPIEQWWFECPRRRWVLGHDAVRDVPVGGRPA